MAFPGYSQSWKNYPYAPEGSMISFPEDEGWHPDEAIEWWYTAGHATGINTGTRYSYMLTYFYYPAYGYDGFRILNLSNDDTGEFIAETTAVNYDVIAEDSLNIMAVTMGNIVESWTNKTGPDDRMVPFEYLLSAESARIGLNLGYISLKPPLILGDNGYFRQGQSSYTYYFSLTNSTVSGEISVDGMTEPVSGTAWIDRQYGTFNPLTEEDYEWFYVQLSNGMDLNIYDLFTEDRQLPDTSTYKHMSVLVDTASQYTTHSFNLERLIYSYTPDSLRCYAQSWRLTAPVRNIDLTIHTVHGNSEVRLPFRFFEGSTVIEGNVDGIPVTGIGFAELLHSYEKPELTITYPSGDIWSSSRALSWEVNNPDDGRPLRYNLEFSLDNGGSFEAIAYGLTDPSFYWTDPPLVNGSQCWFKITAYSVDSTLINSIESTSPAVYDPNLTSLEASVYKQPELEKIEIYPNPTKGLIHIDLETGNPYKYVYVNDLFGRILVHEPVSSRTGLYIDLGTQPEGVYIIGLSSGKEVVRMKLIVEY